MKKIKVKISGMHCASRANNVERSLKKVLGVKDVRVILMMNKAFVEVEDNVKEEELRKAISNAGYKLVGIE